MFDTQRCTYSIAEARAGIKITYRVVIDSAVPGVVPEPQDMGSCDLPGSSGLILFEEVDGSGGQRYCKCDVGLCVPSTRAPTRLAAGTWTNTFLWDGRTWGGPSDTGNPEGAAFTPGDVTLTASAIGTIYTSHFRVTGTFPLHITP